MTKMTSVQKRKHLNSVRLHVLSLAYNEYKQRHPDWNTQRLGIATKRYMEIFGYQEANRKAAQS